MMGGKRHRWSHRLEAWGLRLVSIPLGPLGWRGTQRLGGGIGIAAYRLTRIRVAVAKENIARAFGDTLDATGVERLAREAYRNWGKTFLEFARFGAMERSEVRARVRIEHAEILDRLLDEGKGAILFTGHFGNFDLFGAAIAARGYPLAVLAQRQHNRLVDERMRSYREKMGARVIYRGAGVGEILRALRRNELVAIVGDQDAGERGIFVDFLGTSASTPRGPALLARRADAPILFCTIERREDGSHTGRLEGPIRPRRDTGEEEDVRRLTADLTNRLAAAVRRRPDHYFWPHRRWKTRPAGDEKRP